MAAVRSPHISNRWVACSVSGHGRKIPMGSGLNQPLSGREVGQKRGALLSCFLIISTELGVELGHATTQQHSTALPVSLLSLQPQALDGSAQAQCSGQG